MSATAIPKAVAIENLASVGGRVQLEGTVATKFADQEGSCVVVPVAPGRLHVGAPVATACDTEDTTGQTVGLTTTYVDNNNLGEISATRTDPATGQVTVGPVLLAFQEGSGCGPVSASGAGWLWVYEGCAVAGPVVLRLSATTGQLLDTVDLSINFSVPVMAADADGLWFGPSVTSGWNGAPPAALYRLAPGASTPVAMDKMPERPLCWAVAEGSTVWAGIAAPSCGSAVTVRYNGLDPRPAFTTPARFTTLDVVGGSAGLWTVVSNRGVDATQSIVVRIDPTSGRETVVARSSALTLEFGELRSGEVALSRGSLYVLSLPYSTSGGLGRLFRITPG
ncbi:MAG: hypothetical protein ACRDV6_03815 [Acidimicrobiales bacterium]